MGVPSSKLTIVGSGDRLERKVFATSRLAEFCSKSELEKQTGHPVDPLVILKELVDNAADEAEKSGIAPVIEITVANGEIVIADNGPGATVERVLDFNVRVSDKEAYVSPTRGAQGNALKTIIAMPYVLDGKRGETVIEARGIRHSVLFEADPIRREPRVTYEPTRGKVKTGTRVTVRWPVSASSQLEAAKARFLLFAADFAFLNPHLTLRVTWGSKRWINTKAAASVWTKWSPADPIPAHWYPLDRFERLITAHIANDQDQGSETTVRDFVASFRGLSGSIKRTAILDDINASRLSLAKFYDDGCNHDGVARLLAAIRDMSKPVKPKDLGVIGRDHLEYRFREAGAELETFKYIAKFDTTDDLPWGVEIAFAWYPASSRRLITGVNFSPAIINPFRHLGDWQSLDDVLGEQRASPDEPVLALVHLVCPRLSFTDRGKTALVLGDVYITDDEIDETELAQAPNSVEREIGDAIIDAVTKVTATWAKKRARLRSVTIGPRSAGASG